MNDEPVMDPERHAKGTEIYNEIYDGILPALPAGFLDFADVMLGQLAHVFRRPARKVHPNPARDHHPLDTVHMPRVFHQLHERSMVRPEQLAGLGVDA